MTIPTDLGGVGGQDGETSRKATSEVAARQRGVDGTSNMDVEGVTLDWNTSREEGRLPPRTGRKRQLRRRVPKGLNN